MSSKPAKMPCSAAACGCASRFPAIASATTRSCSPRRPADAPANTRSISAPASARRGLALAARVAGLKVTLVEIDADLSALAAGNARLNHLDDRVRAVTADAEDAAALAAAGLAAGSADRVLMNPPFHDATRQNLSPDPRRRLAYAASPGLLPRWVASAALAAQAARRADADLACRLRSTRCGPRSRRSSAISACCRSIRAPMRRRFACWCAR